MKDNKKKTPISHIIIGICLLFISFRSIIMLFETIFHNNDSRWGIEHTLVALFIVSISLYFGIKYLRGKCVKEKDNRQAAHYNIVYDEEYYIREKERKERNKLIAFNIFLPIYIIFKKIMK